MIEWCWIEDSKINIEQLFQPRDKFCFLVGSGVSVDPPSCFLTGFQFMKKLLGAVIPSEEKEDIIDLMNHKREKFQISGNFLRFEQFMEYLQRWIDPKLQVLDCFAQRPPPNQNHLFLAQMLIQGHTIITVNFDCLIEDALLELGVPAKLIYPVIYRQDWEKEPNTRVYYVYKLHGSLIDIRNNRDCRESLQVTLEQIARGKGEFFQLNFSKYQVLKSLLQQYDLVVVGYSGLDDFDIMPTLWNIQSTRRILWIRHDSGRPPERALIEKLVDKSSMNATTNRDDRVTQNLLTFVDNNTRLSSELFHIKVHTGQLLERLWHLYSTTPLPNMTKTSSTLREFPLPAHLNILI